jgi:stress response protein YsnF
LWSHDREVVRSNDGGIMKTDDCRMKEEVSYTITTTRSQRLRLEEERLRRARRDGGSLPPLRALMSEAIEMLLDRPV